MNQSVQSSWRASALVPFAIVLVVGSAVAGIASFYLAAAPGPSAHDVQTAAVVVGQQGANALGSAASGCQEVPPSDGSDPEVPNYVCKYTNQDSVVQASTAEGSAAPATPSNRSASQVNPAQVTDCQQIGVDQGDGEYGPLPIYNCEITTAIQDAS